MKSFRTLFVLLFGALSINMFAAGSIVIKDGATTVSGSTFAMPQMEKVGDAPSAATLTVVQTDMNTMSVTQQGDEVISATLSGSNLYLTFNPVDTAGQYTSIITISGTDLSSNKVSASVTVTAVCLWGDMTYHVFSWNIDPDVKSTLGLSIYQTAYYDLTKVEFIPRMSNCSGSTLPGEYAPQVYEFSNPKYAAYYLRNSHTIARSISLPDIPAMPMACEVKLTDSHGNTFSMCREVRAGTEVSANKSATVLPGFDLTKCFSASGDAVMDTLYLLSETFCAIYVPNSTKDAYEFWGSYDPSVKKRIILAESSKKLYFSGKCSYAYTGDDGYTKPDTITLNIEGLPYYFTNLEGAFNLVGSSAATNIYIDNLNVTTQARNKNLSDNRMQFLLCDMPGASNVFAIASLMKGSDGSGNTKYYKANFHISGENKLTSNYGARFFLNFLNYAKVGSEGFTVASAPIAIRSTLGPEDVGQAQLNFDDYWIDGKSTNGFLDLSTNGQTDVGSIDLGNKWGQCNFYGGQYKLASGSTRKVSNVYLYDFAKESWKRLLEKPIDYFMSNSLAINYRVFKITLAVGAEISVNIEMCAFGNDMVKPGQVNIFGGTFNTYGVSEEYMNSPWDYCYFRDKHDLRIPAGGYIVGGTFNNCDLYMCDTVSSMGVNPILYIPGITDEPDTLCKYSIPVSGTNSDGSAIFEIPSQFKYNVEGMQIPMDMLFGLDDVNGMGINKTPKHGINADEGGKVNVYVPCDMDASLEPEPVIKNKNWWTNVFPQYSANATGETMANSGDTIYNCFFADVNLDSLVYKKGNSLISIAFNTYRGNLLNTENFDIQRRLYIVMPVETNRWYNFIAPFDISNVYEVNTVECPDAKTTNASEWKAYKNQLRDKNYDLILGFAPQLIFGGHQDMLDLVNIVGDTMFTQHGEFFRVDPLYAYNGSNPDAAHFFLYYPEDSTTHTEGVWKIKNGEFDYDWKYATPVTKTFKDEDGVIQAENAPVIMQAKHVYGISFPGRQMYPYWNNRYIILEGYGKQTVYGSAEQANFVTTAAAGTGKWGGNYTFTNFTAQPNMYVLDTRLGSETIGKYILASSVSEMEGIEKDLFNEDRYITSHFAYIVANGSLSAPTQMTGMDEDDKSGAPTISEVSFTVVQNNSLFVTANKPQIINIFNMQGQQVFSRNMTKNETARVDLLPGVYVVSGATDNIKVSIK